MRSGAERRKSDARRRGEPEVGQQKEICRKKHEVGSDVRFIDRYFLSSPAQVSNLRGGEVVSFVKVKI